MTIERLIGECKDAYFEGNYEEGICICNEILRRDLNNQTALEYKARCLEFLDEFEEAMELLDNAIKLYPNNTYYYEISIDVLMQLKEYGKLIKCYERLLEIGPYDESNMKFLKGDYETCISLRIDQLIERERYVDAWKCYNLLVETEGIRLKREEKIRRFKRHVSEYTTMVKKRQYFVKPSSDEAKSKLIRFLKENGFECIGESESVLLIDVVDKTCSGVSADDADSIIFESKFYDKVNYYPRKKIVHKKIFDDENNLLYGGYTLNNAPYGFGTAYFENGNVFREGIFDIKRIAQGKEYYPSGQLRFEGEWYLTRGYGPNAPCNGNAYAEDGEMIYSGKFEIKVGGVGWPMIRNPKGFPAEQKQRPKIKYK